MSLLAPQEESLYYHRCAYYCANQFRRGYLLNGALMKTALNGVTADRTVAVNQLAFAVA